MRIFFSELCGHLVIFQSTVAEKKNVLQSKGLGAKITFGVRWSSRVVIMVDFMLNGKLDNCSYQNLHTEQKEKASGLDGEKMFLGLPEGQSPVSASSVNYTT